MFCLFWSRDLIPRQAWCSGSEGRGEAGALGVAAGELGRRCVRRLTLKGLARQVGWEPRCREPSTPFLTAGQEGAWPGVFLWELPCSAGCSFAFPMAARSLSLLGVAQCSEIGGCTTWSLLTGKAPGLGSGGAPGREVWKPCRCLHWV